MIYYLVDGLFRKPYVYDLHNIPLILVPIKSTDSLIQNQRLHYEMSQLRLHTPAETMTIPDVQLSADKSHSGNAVSDECSLNFEKP